MSRAGSAVLVIGLLVGACGDDGAVTTSMASTTLAPMSTGPHTTTTTDAAERAGVAGLVTGRADDGSIEVTVWLEGAPGTLHVAFDSDDSLTDSSQAARAEAETVVRVVDGELLDVQSDGVLTGGAAATGFDAVAASNGPHTVVRLFVLSDEVPRTGSVWVWAGDSVAFGATLGGACDPAPAGRPAGVGPACREAVAG